MRETTHGLGQQRDARKGHQPQRNPGGQQVAVGPGFNDLVGHHHQGGDQGGQQQGGHAARAVKRLCGLLEALHSMFCAHHAGVLDGEVGVNKGGHVKSFQSLCSQAARFRI